MDGRKNPSKKRRIMNCLSLAERLAVINEYNAIPNVRYLARRFNCGRTQIRNILRRREDYFEEWQNDPNPIRLPKRRPGIARSINVFLYEWIQRCRSYPILITDELLCQKGQELADHLAIAEYKPNRRWLDRFKQKYKITDSTLLSNGMDSSVNCNDLMKKSLSVADIIEDVSATTDFEEFTPSDIKRNNTNENSMMDGYEDTFNSIDSSNEMAEYLSSDNSRSIESENDLVASDQYNEYLEIVKSNVRNTYSRTPSKKKKDDNKKNPVTTGLSRNQHAHTTEKDVEDNLDQDISVYYPDINIDDGMAVKPIVSYEEALKYLEPLEHFALFNENIRAIGLINQIENIFKDEIKAVAS